MILCCRAGSCCAQGTQQKALGCPGSPWPRGLGSIQSLQEDGQSWSGCRDLGGCQTAEGLNTN